MCPSEGVQFETVNELLTQNTQYSVCYITWLNPDCKMCFIGAVYNTPMLNMGHISNHLDELKMVLSERGCLLSSRFLTQLAAMPDMPTASPWFQQRTLFLTADVLIKYGLDGECLIAFRQQAEQLSRWTIHHTLWSR
jgi:hypothetical protein